MNIASLKRHYYFRSFILLGFSLLLTNLLVTETLSQYLAPRLHGLAYVTLFILVVLTGASLRQAIIGPTQYECDCAELHNVPRGFLKSLVVYGLFVVPLFMAFVMPDKILGSAIAEKRGLNLLSGESKTIAAATKPTTQTIVEKTAPKQTTDQLAAQKPLNEAQIRELFAKNDFGDFYTDLAVSMYKEPIIKLTDKIFLDGLTTLELYPKEFSEHRLETMGFVYREPNFLPNQFVVARFSVSCCTADASVFGVLVEAEQAQKLVKDSWVKISGKLTRRSVDGYEMLVLQASDVQPVKAPKDPYVYYNYDFGTNN